VAWAGENANPIRRKINKKGNPAVMVFFILLWQRGIKGDFRMMFGKSPLTPLFQRGV